MELKRIDNFWHFFATQNQLFLKKKVGSEVRYCFTKNSINLCHTLNPKFLSESRLSMKHMDYELGVEHYASAKRRFGFKLMPENVHQRLFFPKEILKLNSNFSLYVERDRFRNFKVTIEPFHPRNIREIMRAANLVSETLWGFKYFSETIKN
ncbi:hypothetical protein [Negadavirga shengliensis]|uniref:DUF3137 domain-containing protein n=1 Tax=Negadavirga shengliensis TaxID=1389218 RepID=A0ABV9T5W4_9BACT